MKKQVNSLIINLGLLISGSLTMFSGMLIQINYHMGNHGSIVFNKEVLNMNYGSWSYIHTVSSFLLLFLTMFHITTHWKLYKAIIKKRLFAKNRQIIILSILFALVAVSGLIPWITSFLNNDRMLEKAFIEIHDKLAIILSVHLIIHVIKRMKWFFLLPLRKP